MSATSPQALEHVVRRELAREGVTMALYVAITLLGALVAIPSEDVPGTVETVAVIWGGAAGLAIAHWLAFDIGARLYHTKQLDRLHRLGGPVALAGALAVAAITSIPIVVAPDDIAAEVAACVLALILAVAGFAIGRRNGEGFTRSLIGGLVVLVVAGLVIGVKLFIES